MISDASIDFAGDAVSLYTEPFSILQASFQTDECTWLSYKQSSDWYALLDRDTLCCVQSDSWYFFMQMLAEEKASAILPLSLAKAAHKQLPEYSLEAPEITQHCQWIMYKKSSTDNSRAWLDEQIKELALGFFTA